MEDISIVTIPLNLKEFRDAGLNIDDKTKNRVIAGIIQGTLTTYVTLFLATYFAKGGNPEDMVSTLTMLANSLKDIDKVVGVEDSGDEVDIHFRFPSKIPEEKVFEIMHIIPKMVLLSMILENETKKSEKLGKYFAE